MVGQQDVRRIDLRIRFGIAPATRPARSPWWVSALVFTVGQSVAVLSVVGVASTRRVLAEQMWWSWDGAHFLAIAAHGYTQSLAAHVDASPAFFPGYPALISAMATVSRMPLPAAGIVISALSGLAFAIGFDRLVSDLTGGDLRTGRIAVLLAATAPLSIVFTMVYSEALFCALAVWCLVAVLRQRWLTAGALCVAAGTVRQSALALVVAIVCAAVGAALRRQATWRTWVAAGVAPLGLFGYFGWIAVSTGHLDGWFEAERNGWHAQLDYGASVERFTYHALLVSPSVLDVVTVAVIALALILLVASAIDGAPGPVLAYSAAVIAIDISSGGIMNSKVRLLIPAFTLLIPIAVWLRRQTPFALATVAACLVAAGTWYSAYALVISGIAI